ncbi:MAG: protein-glutamate O-methyltransferase CheR [Elusimicrobiaceae bacterium]|nr:protein-glutamate O-methyltransferase CheR [Elusimicrobiaceae bacterium]
MSDISDSEFKAVRELLYASTGIMLNDSKRTLVLNRLRNRLKTTGKTNYAEYLLLLKNSGPEMEEFINAVTTNETFFFRHDEQLSYLVRNILPELVKQRQAQNRLELNVWSAACSTGEEPYTLAILLESFFEKLPGWQFRIHATDINTEVLADAKAGLFSERSLSRIKNKPEMRWFKRAGSRPDCYELDEAIRRRVKFREHNLMAPAPFRGIDLLLARNVMIYFDKTSKNTAVRHLAAALEQDGYFIVSLSETLNDVKTDLQYLKLGIYARNGKQLRQTLP